MVAKVLLTLFVILDSMGGINDIYFTLCAAELLILTMIANDSTTASVTIDFDSIKNLTVFESQAVDQLILDELSSDVVLINQIGHYIIGNGGKRLRPMLLLLAAKALGQGR